MYYTKDFTVERNPMDISNVKEISEIPVAFKHPKPSLGRNHVNVSNVGKKPFTCSNSS
jgi:hypothetical protein